MSGGKLVFVSEMYSPGACMRSGSVQSVVPCSMEEGSFSRRSLARDRAGQARMACWKDSGRFPHRGQVVSGLSSNQESWAAR